jgi:hypothetical protein
MFLELSARYLMERHQAMENDPTLALRAELRRRVRAAADETDRSAGIGGVSLGDGTGRRRHAGTDLGRLQHFDPSTCTEQYPGHLIRPVHSQPEP